jgi:hypothetical protein
MHMTEPKPIASLSSGLLARKGAARPAMRRQLIGNNNGVAAGSMQEDCGWNDMGYDVDPDPSTPMDYDHFTGVNPLANAVPEVKPEVKQQQERIAEQLHVQAEEIGIVGEDEAPAAPVVPFVSPRATVAKPADRPAPRLRAAPGSKEKSAFTLRLDGERHLKLRLACAVSNKSAQQLVTAALDAFIDSIPELSTLAAHVPGKKQA